MDKYIPPFNLTDEMLNYVSEIMDALGQISGLSSLDKLPRLRKSNRIKSIHSSLSIENNTLTLRQVTDILEGKQVLGPAEEIHEVKNTFEAYRQLEKINTYDIGDLLKMHKMMMSGLIKDCGKYRLSAVGVFEDKKAIHIAPPYKMVPKLIENLFSWMESSKVHPLIKSSIFHYEFEFIHPFSDGNGRIGRMWQTAILANWKPIFAWIPIESLIKDQQQSYYDAIALSTKNGNSNAFILFMLQTIFNAVKNIASDAKNHLNHMSSKVKQLLKVINDYPMTANEIMQLLNLKSKETFRKNYLYPAIEAGLVGLTLPEKPTSKNQAYFKK